MVPLVTSYDGFPASTCASVDLPEPFGPITACTSPAFTLREMPFRISRSPIPACRSFISSTKPLIECCLQRVHCLTEKRPVSRERIARRPGTGAEPGPASADPVDEIPSCHVYSVCAPEAQPTLPSSVMPSSCCASTANSIGSSLNTSRQKPLTIIDTACSALTPRCLQ